MPANATFSPRTETFPVNLAHSAHFQANNRALRRTWPRRIRHPGAAGGGGGETGINFEARWKNWTIHLLAGIDARRRFYLSERAGNPRAPPPIAFIIYGRELHVHARYYAPAFSAEHVLRRAAINGRPRAPI